MATSRDEKLIEEIRDRRVYCRDEWFDIKKEAARDMDFVSGNPWEEADKQKRKATGRPIITVDEFGQYINQVINDLRMNKRGIKVTAKGNGATDDTARFRQGKIRDIEYRSNAQQAYTTMAADAIQRSYGYLKVTSKRSATGWNKEPIIEPIVNPDLIEPDPDFLRADGADWKYLFEYRVFGSVNEFNRRFPKADKKTFDASDIAVPGGWYDGKKAIVAHYWAQEAKGSRRKLLLKPKDGIGDPQDAWEDEAGDVDSESILDQRDEAQYTVCDYVTNGFEILERTVWPGQSIPYVGCYGKILYVNGKRVILSMVRLARDPAMLLNVVRSKQMETVGALLAFPYFFTRGSLKQDALDLMARSVHEPVVGVPVEVLPNGEPAPFPQKQIGEPAIQALEMLAEAMRRAIQSGMGQGFLPTDAQKPNTKSGTALDKINSSAQRGSFHFSDNYNGAVTRTGVLVDEVLSAFIDTEQETSIRTAQDDVMPVHVNGPAPVPGAPPPAYAEMNKKAGLPPSVMLDAAHEHDVTISVGPWEDSQRESANTLVQSLVNNAGFMQELGPQKGAKVLALSVKLLNAGPQADAIADIIDPPQQDGPNPQQMQQQLQMQGQELNKAKEAIGTLSMEIKTKKADLDSRERIATADRAQRADDAQKDRALKLAMAHIAASKDADDSARESAEEALALGQQLASDALEADKARAHDIGMAHVNAAVGADASAQAHAQGLDAGDVAHQHGLETQEQAAALAPGPEGPQ